MDNPFLYNIIVCQASRPSYTYDENSFRGNRINVVFKYDQQETRNRKGVI